MSRIISVQTTLKNVYLKGDFRISHTVMRKEQPRVFIRVEDDRGNYGLGEAAPLSFFNGEVAQTIKMMIDTVLAPAVINMDTLQVRKAIIAMNRAIPGNNTAKTGLEMALWDLAGKVLHLPIYQLLGGKYRDKVRMAYVLGLKELPAMVEEAKSAVRQGFKTLKVKLTAEVEKDHEMIKTIRENVGNDVLIRADANSAYSVKDALLAVRVLEPYRLQYLEQPCSPDNLEGLLEISKNSTIPIAADESLLSVKDALRLIRGRFVDHLVIKLIKVGGILAGLQIADMAYTAGLGCTLVSPIETSIGAAAGVTLAAVAPAAGVDHELNGPDYLEEDFASGLIHQGNLYYPSDKPGLGVNIKEGLFGKGAE
ncbi:MAG: L-Ala-D/L-Glu epimerase [Halanaerobiales bacterium]|nr:L-Ala-D/L-Glu epimerase [Halanaerobiales bacterium]